MTSQITLDDSCVMQTSPILTRVVATASPALYSDNRVAPLNDSENQCLAQAKPDAVVNVCLPAFIALWSCLSVVERIATAVQMNLPGCNVIAGDCTCVRSVARQVTWISLSVVLPQNPTHWSG